MKRNDEELWVMKMRDSLREYSEPPPLGGWEKLQKELASPMVVEKKIYSYRIWSSVAAVFVMAVTGISLYFLNSPVAEEIRITSVPPVSVTVTPDILPDNKIPDIVSSTAEPVNNNRYNMVSKLTYSGTKHFSEDEYHKTDNMDTDIIDVIPENGIVEYNETVNRENISVQEETQPQNKKMVRPSGKNKLHLPIEDIKPSKKSNNWSVGLSVNSTGASTLDNASNPKVSASMEQYKIGLEENAVSGPQAIPKEGILYFEDGVPYYVVSSEIDYKHHQPITFGVSVRKGLTNNISLETGLNYTQLNSDISRATGSDKFKQKLHYLGIPIRVNWDFIDSRYFTVYLAGGGIIEKCIYGKIGNEKETVKPVQFSLNGAVGAQYNITKQLGLYVEPGVAYFFDDGSDIQTIRKENPFNFNLQAGIRFSY